DKKKIGHLLIRHSLHGGRRSEVEEHRQGRVCASYQAGLFPKLPFFLRLFQESAITLWYLKRTQADLFVGVDPLNVVLGVIGRKLGWVKRTIFFAVDYSPQRFNNPLLNYAYHAIGRFGALNSDQVWNISRRIMAVREKQGVPDDKNFFIPNSPDFREVKRWPFEKINKHDVVIVGNIIKTLDYETAVAGVETLAKKWSDIRLLIIGMGKYLESLQELVKKRNLAQHVLFLGHKEHKELIEILSRSAVGIALYSGEYSWNYYGDSMKAREYLAAGLPVIISDVPSTAYDIEDAKAGFIIKSNPEELADAIDRLFSDQKLYLQMRNNAIKLARDFSFSKIASKLLEKLL
ncbi:hypothetical protein HKBW3C_02655, partial [Candidatus Hakubella thermalkaliphila]